MNLGAWLNDATVKKIILSIEILILIIFYSFPFTACTPQMLNKSMPISPLIDTTLLFYKEMLGSTKHMHDSFL